MQSAEIVLLAAEIYAGAGIAVALAFVTVGVGRIDPAARGAYLFRPLILPGAALLWPLVLIRWARAVRRQPPAS